MPRPQPRPQLSCPPSMPLLLLDCAANIFCASSEQLDSSCEGAEEAVRSVTFVECAPHCSVTAGDGRAGGRRRPQLRRHCRRRWSSGTRTTTMTATAAPPGERRSVRVRRPPSFYRHAGAAAAAADRTTATAAAAAAVRQSLSQSVRLRTLAPQEKRGTATAAGKREGVK